MRFFPELPKLQKLNLSSFTLKEVGLDYLAKCPALRSLNLLGTRLQPNELFNIKHTPLLDELKIDSKLHIFFDINERIDQIKTTYPHLEKFKEQLKFSSYQNIHMSAEDRF